MNAARPQLRPGLRFVEQVYRGEASFVVKDPATSKYFRFRPGEARVLRCLDGTSTAAQVVARLAEEGMRVSVGAIEAFARQLTAIGLIERSLAERSTLQIERLREERRKRRKRALFRGDISRMRWSLGDPDAMFDRTMPYLRWCFSRAFVIASVALFVAYFAILAATWTEFSAAVASRYSPATLSVGSIVMLWVTIVWVTVVHEFGHGYACKHFGGEVHEIGVMVLYLQPAMYCNVNDAWSFPDLRARLWVTAAGGWIELLVAAIAGVVWLLVAPGTFISDAAVVTMVIAGGMTLIANANPLLPLDGYFALTDYLEIPNLRLRALEYVRWWLARHVLRLERPEPAVSERERRVFLIYGALASAYITFVLLFIASLALGWVRQALGFVGVAIAVGGVLMMKRGALREGWQAASIALRGRFRRADGRARGWRRAAPLVLLLLLLAAPWPRTARGSFIAAPARLQIISAPSPGIVGDVLVEEGQRVEAGTPLIRLIDFERATAIARASRTLDSVAVAEVRARARELASESAVLGAERAGEAGRLAALRDGSAASLVRAVAPGIVLTARPAEMRGRRVAAGRAMLGVGDPDSIELRVAFAGDGATLVRAGQTIRVITDADPTRPMRATIASIAPAARAGAAEARVRLAAEHAWRPGVRGEARVEVGRSTVLGALVRAVRTRIRGDILL